MFHAYLIQLCGVGLHNTKVDIVILTLIFWYTPISKNVVGENGEWQLSNGNCTTERNCGFHTWYAKTMSSSRSAKLLEGA